MVLAICNSGQYELAAYNSVKKELELIGETIISFKQDLCLRGEYLSFICDKNNSKHLIKCDGKFYNADEFRSIWYIKPMLPKSLLKYKPESHAAFINKQFYTVRESLGLVLEEKIWLNDLWQMQRAENKIFQLKTAQFLGLEVPKTIFSSNPKEIKEFYHSNRKTVIKTISPTIILDHVFYTNLLNDENIKNLTSAKYCPAIYQEYIEKKYELRITIVGEKIFAAKIFSQEDIATSVDWRVRPLVNDFQVRMETTELPAEVSRVLIKYMKLLGLRFGCIDMIVTKDDRYVFLEINPNGQWYFVQLNTEMKIAKEIAFLLTSKT